ncbi:unnamed protein product [Parnassius apollo]|uniref:(apollo) hypothetical protein n=1 Tax=Parnassius apollo TaxID=110799 RepID=A0A8S3XX36_PARAO|nr:unnamed protein product [Parnassius apollo]
MSKQEENQSIPREPNNTDFMPNETWRIVKNVVIISLAFMVHFTAYSGVANLQSSINAEAGLGTASLAAVYAGLIFSSIFLTTIVIKYDNGRSGSSSVLSSMALLAVTMKLLVEPNQLMLIIINVFIGLQQAFFGADFTAAFVSCAIGTGTIGFVMMTYGVADAIGCAVSGYLAKITGRLPLLCTAAIIQTGLVMAILIWRPHHNEAYAFYLIAALWGLCDALWIVQINSLFGILFPGREEAAFANFRLWKSVGYIVAYIISPHLRTSTKTYLLIVLMIIGVSLYFVVEYRDRKAKKKLEEKKLEEKNQELQNIGCDNIAFQNLD